MNKTLESQRKEAATLFEENKYTEIIALLSDGILEKFKDAELYAWRSRAHYRLDDDADKVLQFAQGAIEIDPTYYMGYLARGYGWYAKNDYEKTITDLNKAIELNPSYATLYNFRGITWFYKAEYDKAIADYNKAIELSPDYAIAYNNRGNAWSEKSENNKALEDYNKAIELDPEYAYAYNNRGNISDTKGDHTKAIEDYNKAIKLNPDYAYAYFNRGNTRRKSGKDFEKSIKDYEQFLALISPKEDIWTIRARDFIQKLQEQIKDKELKEIGNLTSEIKKLLLISDGCITHYTGLTVTKKLILEKENKFRISEGAFLNDTSEGTELFEFLQYQFSSLTDGLVAEAFAPKPFIGSFVSESKHDDLNLWRFYGKENGVEAKGCAMTLKMKEFIEAINFSITSKNINQTASSEDDINFYRVAYWDHDKSKINFQIPNSTKKVEKELNKLMGELKGKVANYKTEDKSVLEKYINSIAFLFKSDAYKNENEIRLVIKGIEFEKKFDLEANPPRVYIELINIRHLVEQITLGPKTDKPDEWAAAFYYSYDKEIDETKKPKKILISRLPYK